MTTARHAQRETPEVVAMETSVVIPPPCKCALLLETVTASWCHVNLHLTGAEYNVSKPEMLLMLRIKYQVQGYICVITPVLIIHK